MTLTIRQQEICDDIVDGLTNEQIAKKKIYRSFNNKVTYAENI